MSKFVQLFKAEISRLARHEVKVMTAATRKATSAYRTEIATLKREVTKLDCIAHRWPAQTPRSDPGGVRQAVRQHVRHHRPQVGEGNRLPTGRRSGAPQ